ncbi:hypothetical protein BSM4216_3847 [Bacillus smithii]|nr:hypothetical protein BSM4216_3847 [Bacillus smithii]
MLLESQKSLSLDDKDVHSFSLEVFGTGLKEMPRRGSCHFSFLSL